MSLLLLHTGVDGVAKAPNTNALDLETDLSQKATAPDSTSLSITGSFTIEAWVKVESAPANNAEYIIAGKGKSGSTFPSYSLAYINDAGTLTVRGIYTNSANSAKAVAATASTLTLGTWFHLAVTYNSAGGANSGKIYRDGSEIGTATQDADTLEDNAEVFSIGSDPAAKFFDGIVDDVRVWNVVRTATEISSNYNKQLTGTESGLAAYWRLNNNGNDETANANNLTVNTGTFVTDTPFA